MVALTGRVCRRGNPCGCPVRSAVALSGPRHVVPPARCAPPRPALSPAASVGATLVVALFGPRLPCSVRGCPVRSAVAVSGPRHVVPPARCAPPPAGSVAGGQRRGNPCGCPVRSAVACPVRGCLSGPRLPVRSAVACPVCGCLSGLRLPCSVCGCPVRSAVRGTPGAMRAPRPALSPAASVGATLVVALFGPRMPCPVRGDRCARPVPWGIASSGHPQGVPLQRIRYAGAGTHEGCPYNGFGTPGRAPTRGAPTTVSSRRGGHPQGVPLQRCRHAGTGAHKGCPYNGVVTPGRAPARCAPTDDRGQGAAVQRRGNPCGCPVRSWYESCDLGNGNGLVGSRP